VSLDKICVWHEEKVIVWTRYNLLCCFILRSKFYFLALDMYIKYRIHPKNITKKYCSQISTDFIIIIIWFYYFIYTFIWTFLIFLLSIPQICIIPNRYFNILIIIISDKDRYIMKYIWNRKLIFIWIGCLINRFSWILFLWYKIMTLHILLAIFDYYISLNIHHVKKKNLLSI
jgi:hypothetical protein